MNLTKKEQEALITLLAEMNYYEMMAILSKTTDDNIEMANLRANILSAYNKLANEFNSTS